MTINEYCTKLRKMTDLLGNIDAPIPGKNVVTYIIPVVGKVLDMFIRLQNPLPSWVEICTILLYEESRLQSRLVANGKANFSWLIVTRRLTRWSNLPLLGLFSVLRSHDIGQFINLTLKMRSFMVICRKPFTCTGTKDIGILLSYIMFASFNAPFMVSSRPHEVGIEALRKFIVLFHDLSRQPSYLINIKITHKEFITRSIF